mmetsp:Transcript_116581/g.341198  ORF Transcript_116581/g.341198 Transcript_116581/m.341198 type:complete len:83 (-) Transcript_116581:1335-1583(-)
MPWQAYLNHDALFLMQKQTEAPQHVTVLAMQRGRTTSWVEVRIKQWVIRVPEVVVEVRCHAVNAATRKSRSACTGTSRRLLV